MPHEIIDWSQAVPEDSLSRAAELLHEGKLVVLPTDTVYVVAAQAFHPQAAQTLAQYASNQATCAVALADARETIDWLPHLSGCGRRVTRAAWPGPIILQGTGAALGLAARLPATVRGLVETDGLLSLWAPGHAAIPGLIRKLGGPLILVELPGVTTPAHVQERFADADVFLLADGPTYFRQPPAVVRCAGKDLTLVRPSMLTAAMIEDLARCRILFVCTGNTCRSPLAMALCTSLLARRLGCSASELPGRGFQVLSAGLAAIMGCEASPEAVTIAGELGADLTQHRSQPLTAELLAHADFLFTMTHGHLRVLESLDPAIGPEPRLLSPDGADIADPIGRDGEVYMACARQILASLEEWLPVILASA